MVLGGAWDGATASAPVVNVFVALVVLCSRYGSFDDAARAVNGKVSSARVVNGEVSSARVVNRAVSSRKFISSLSGVAEP